MKELRITLINVQILDGNNLVPPMGLLSIAAVLEKAGHNVQVFDKDPKFFDVTDKVKEFNPDIIGIGFLTAGYKKALSLTKELKQKIPDAVYCYGGVHTTVEPINVLNNFMADFVVVGEGELTMLEACERIKNGKSLKGVKGLIYKEKNKIANNSYTQKKCTSLF